MEREKKKAERVEVTVVLGEERSWKPVLNGQRVVNAVQVMRRVDLRGGIVEFVPGWGIFDEKIEEPTRVQVNFVPRLQMGQGDVEEYIRLLNEAKQLPI